MHCVANDAGTGHVRLVDESGLVQLIYITGGMAEVRPDEISIWRMGFSHGNIRANRLQQVSGWLSRPCGGLPIDSIAQRPCQLQAELALLPSVSGLVQQIALNRGEKDELGRNGLGCSRVFVPTLAFVPQVVQVYRSCSAKDISLGMYSIFVCGSDCIGNA